ILSASFLFFFFTLISTSLLFSLSLHDALPIFHVLLLFESSSVYTTPMNLLNQRLINFVISGLTCPYSLPTCCAVVVILSISKFPSEEHTSELQSRFDLVCRLLLEKKKY